MKNMIEYVEYYRKRGDFALNNVKTRVYRRRRRALSLNNITFIFIIASIINISMLAMTLVPFRLELFGILLNDPAVFLLNYFPIMLTLLTLFFLSGNITASFVSVSILSFLIAYVNRTKLLLRDDPFVFSDIFLTGEARQMIMRYGLPQDITPICILIILICVAICCRLFSKKRKKMPGKVRFSGAVISVSLLAFFLHMLIFNPGFAIPLQWHEEFGDIYKPSDLASSKGVVYCFLNSIPSAFPSPPDGYDKDLISSVLDEYETPPLDESLKVNIISIMLESFNDFSKFDTIEFNVSPYENFHKLKNNSYSGTLYTNSFAGNTIMTERTFLTGMGGKDFTKNTLSHVWYLRKQGYYTEAMHPYYGWFYDRKKINSYLGFINFDYYENKYENIDTGSLRAPLYSGFLSDIDFFDVIKKGFESAVERGEKYFNFSVTYQNHGPYEEDFTCETEYIKNRSDYPEKEYNILNNYFNGIQQTDIAIGELQEYTDNRDEPIVLILFGDHNPFLGSENCGYDAFDINIDVKSTKGAENYYSTPYLIYANNAAKNALGKDFNETGNTISPLFLMNEFFEYAGISGSNYSKYLESLKKQYDVLNPLYMKKNGRYLLRKYYKDDEKITERQHLEFYLKNDAPPIE